MKNLKNATGAEYQAEAAIKILRSIESPLSNGEPIDKDGTGGGGGSDVESFVVDVAANGFLLTVMFDDGFQEKTIHENLDEVLEVIKKKF